jgi:S-methylmethionine-dependent homocysteine/selenocysteine methylase
VSVRIFKHITNASRQVWLDLYISDNYELRQGTIIYIVQLYLTEYLLKFINFQARKIFGTECWQFVTFQTILRTEQ